LRYFRTSSEIFQLGVLMHDQFPLSGRNLEDLLHERGIDACRESVQQIGKCAVRDLLRPKDSLFRVLPCELDSPWIDTLAYW